MTRLHITPTKARSRRKQVIDDLRNAPELTPVALAGIPREKLEALLVSVVHGEAWILPWGGTCVIASDRWASIEAAALGCLARVPGLEPTT